MSGDKREEMKQFTSSSSLCYAARIPRLRVNTSVFNGYPVTQYEEAPYRRRRMSYMKTPPLDVLLRCIPRVVYPPEIVGNTVASEVEVNERFPVSPPPASTTRSLSYPPPRPPQPLRKYSPTAPYFSFPIHAPTELLCIPLLYLLCPSHLLVTLSCAIFVSLHWNY